MRETQGRKYTGPQIQAIIHQGIEITEGSATHLHGIQSIHGVSEKMFALSSFSFFDIVQNLSQGMMPLYKVDLSIFFQLA